MKAVRVVLDAMQPMLRAIVKDVIATHSATEIVAEDVAADQLPGVLRTIRPDVLVLGGAGAVLAGSDRFVELLRGGGAPLRIVALSDGNRSAILHELRPHVTVIEQLSPQALLSAIIGAPLAEGGRAQ